MRIVLVCAATLGAEALADEERLLTREEARREIETARPDWLVTSGPDFKDVPAAAIREYEVAWLLYESYRGESGASLEGLKRARESAEEAVRLAPDFFRGWIMLFDIANEVCVWEVE
ncbi:MAG: hypothetical protein K8I02_10945, partial [Candidatus Methylomirabilis sp.]|nr:hypothetical protein [Deltaproteobacteria bacterium]